MLSLYLLLMEDPIDESKFEQVYHEYRHLMMSVALSILQNPQDAEEAVQDALTAIARNMKAIGDPDSARTKGYVVQAAKSAAHNALKKRKRRVACAPLSEIDSELAARHVDPDTEDREALLRIIRFIGQMKPQYREVLSLSLFHQLKPSQIAVHLHRPLPTVKTQLKRGKKILEKFLQEEQK